MNKKIAISDDVYRRLKREKGDRSFSEIIAWHLDESRQIADVTEQQILDAEVCEDMNSEIKRLNTGTEQRPDDRTT